MLILQNASSYPLLFLMVDSSDHITPKTGLSPTVVISKNGGSFASPSGSVSEIGNGWYKVAGNGTDSNTLGSLVLHASASGADPADSFFEVVSFDPRDAVRFGLSSLPNATAGAVNGLPLCIDSSKGVNIGQILGTTVATPATAGILDINVKNINNVSTSSVSTINANLGTSQPLNFTGTSSSALAKVDVIDFGSTAGTFTSGVPKVNAVLLGSQPNAITFAQGIVIQQSQSNTAGLTIQNNGSAPAVSIQSSSYGMEVSAGSHGILVIAGGGGDGYHVVGDGAGYGMGIYGGSGGGSGMMVQGGSSDTSDSHGIIFQGGNSSNGRGVLIIGNNAAPGMQINGGSSGDGLHINSGASGGNGFYIQATSGNGFVIEGSGNGMTVTGNGGQGLYVNGSSYGFYVQGNNGGMLVYGNYYGMEIVGNQQYGLYVESYNTDASVWFPGANSSGMHIWGGWSSGDCVKLDTNGNGSTAFPVNNSNIATAVVDAIPQISHLDANVSDAVSAAMTALTTALTEDYSADNADATVAQLLYEIRQNITDFVISGTTKTVKKKNGSTTAATYTLNDATNPTGITRTT